MLVKNCWDLNICEFKNRRAWKWETKNEEHTYIVHRKRIRSIRHQQAEQILKRAKLISINLIRNNSTYVFKHIPRFPHTTIAYYHALDGVHRGRHGCRYVQVISIWEIRYKDERASKIIRPSGMTKISRKFRNS